MLRLVALAAALAIATSTAQAQPGNTQRFEIAPPQQDYAFEDTSYPVQILVPSIVGLGLFIGGAMAEGPNGKDTDTSEALMTAGLVTSLFAPAIVHLAHGERVRSGASVAMRLGLGLVAGTIGMASHDCGSDSDGRIKDADPFCTLQGFGPGFLVGLGVATLIDTVAFSKQKRVRLLGPAQPQWAPVVTPARGGGQVGIAATF